MKNNTNQGNKVRIFILSIVILSFLPSPVWSYRNLVHEAENPNTSVENLAELAKDENVNVRQEVARNPNTSEDVLKMLVNDKKEEVLLVIAANPNTPEELLVKLAKYGTIDVRREVAKNSSTPMSVLEVLAEDEKEKVRQDVAGNPNTHVVALNILAEDENVEVRRKVASNPNTPAEVLVALAKDSDKWVRWEAENNANMVKLSKDVGKSKQYLSSIEKLDVTDRQTRTQSIHRSPISPSSSITPFKPKIDFGNIDFGNYHALVIGNKNYHYLKSLKTSIHDAKVVSKLLELQYGFKVTLLEDATESTIKKELRKLRRNLTVNDNLLVYYAGHGTIDKATDRGYWQPVDAKSDNPDNWIANDDVSNDLKAMSAKHILIIADSCYSGTLLREDDIRDSVKTGGMKEWIRRMNRNNSRTALTSGGLEPVLDMGDGGHSVFAASFIKTLRDNDRIIDMNTLYEDIKLRVVRNADQTPRYSTIRKVADDLGDFILVPR